MQRYFAVALNNHLFELDNDDYHHIKTVLRMKPKEPIEVVYQNELYLCHLNEQLKPRIVSKINQVVKQNHITIAPALIKENNWNYLLQKATELGVHKIIPLITERTIIKISSNKQAPKIQRWQKILKEASEQSKRLEIPQIFDIINIEQLITEGYDLCFFGSINTDINLHHYATKLKNNPKILVITGPEGGFTAHEEANLIQRGFLPISLGNHVLRAETAPIAAISMINYELME